VTEHSYVLKKKEIVLLTPMRGIAAIFVVFYHAKLQLPNLSYGFIFARSYLWVDFFFILSGFIISYVYRDSILTNKNYKEFFVARFARIYPLHLFVLTLFIIVESTRFIIPTNFAPFTAATKTVSSIFTNLFLIHSWGIHQNLTWNSPSWSISTEWAAYLTFPTLSFIIMKWKKSIFLVAVIIVFSILSAISIYNGSLDITYDYGVFRCILEFFLGMSLYYFYKNDKRVEFFNNDIIMLFTLLTIILLISRPSLAAYDFFIVILFTILVLSLASYEQGIFNKIIGNKFLKLLGDISYSIYLTHVFILMIFYETLKKLFSSTDFALSFNLMESTLYVLIATVTTIIFSYFTYYYVEIPARVYLKKKFVRKKQ
jgi:peptidoglycan/LPS O-acetylase OafA/YrhL